MSKNGHAAIYTFDGVLLGLTEVEGGSIFDEYPRTVSELLTNSSTRKAIDAIFKVHGVVCPPHQHVVHEEDHIIFIRALTPEQWGVPRVTFRICELVTFPRANLHAQMDSASQLNVVVNLVAGAGSVLALGLVLFSVGLASWSHRSEVERRYALDKSRVVRAELDVHSLAYPMALMKAEEFLSLEVMLCYEDCRDQGKLHFCDSMRQIQELKAQGGLIAFISHQWLGWSVPDDAECTQLRSMQHAVASVMRPDRKQLFVWVDYLSVAQRNPCTQSLAIGALPVYVSAADVFIICAPDAVHRDSKEFCGLSTYNLRGWCRMEMFAKACSSGIAHMYLQTGTGISELTNEDFSNLSLHVFEGVFTVQRDMEKLVEPVLGLYSLILSHGLEEKLQFIQELAVLNKDRFFPATYLLQEAGHMPQRRELFGNLPDIMEEHMRDRVRTREVSSLILDIQQHVPDEMDEECLDDGSSFADVCGEELPGLVRSTQVKDRIPQSAPYLVPDTGESEPNGKGIVRLKTSMWSGCCGGTKLDEWDEIVFDNIVPCERFSQRHGAG